MGEGTGCHQAWCASGCEGARSGVHASAWMPAAPSGTEILGVAVRLELLTAAVRPVALVVLEFVDDGRVVEFRLPVGQARALHALIGSGLDRLSAAA